jgi:hypothetical protein
LAALTLIILFSEILKLILIKIKIEGNYWDSLSQNENIKID